MNREKNRIFRVSDEDLNSYDTLTEDDIGLWAVVANGVLVKTVEEKNDAREILRDLADDPWAMDFSDPNDGQSDGDAEDYDDMYDGFVNYDNDAEENYDDDWR